MAVSNASGPPAMGPPQWCNMLGGDEEVFECCWREREGYYKAELERHGVKVKGKTEAYGTWVSAAREEVRLLAEELWAAEARVAHGKPFAVCETGLNWGGTSHIFLCASRTNARVLSFDVEEQRSKPPTKILTERYGSRLTVTIGDSRKVLANLVRSATPPDCNLVFVDGGHTKDIAKADIINCGKMSRPGTPMISDDCHAKGGAGIQGPGKAVNEAVRDGIIAPGTSKRFSDLEWREICRGTYLQRAW